MTKLTSVFAVLKMELEQHYARARWLARRGDLDRASDEMQLAVLSLCKARESLALLRTK